MRLIAYALLSSSLLASASEWTAGALLDRSFHSLVTSEDRIVAYSENKTASSVDGIHWSESSGPGFPILDIAKSKNGGFIALGYEEDTWHSTPLLTKYTLLLKESQDGLEWNDRGGIRYFDGFDLPVKGEIAETFNNYVAIVATESPWDRDWFTLFGSEERIETDRFSWRNNVHSYNGKYYSNLSPPPGTGGNWCYRTDIAAAPAGRSWLFWNRLNNPIDLRAMSDDLLIGQNGIVREGGETYFGNWRDLGTIQGIENGIGLVIPPDPTGTSVYVSTDHLLTWQEEDLPGPTAYRKPIAGKFFNNQWLVLAYTGSHTTIYSHPAPEIEYIRVGDVALTIRYIPNANFKIIACQDEETFNHAVEITFPVKPGSHFRVYTSRDLETWVRYGLEFPSGSTHQFPLDSALRNSTQIYFKAEEFTTDL